MELLCRMLVLLGALVGCCCCLRLQALQQQQQQSVDLTAVPLRALRRTPFGHAMLEAYPVHDAGHRRRPVWATVGLVRLLRVNGTVFHPDPDGAGFAAAVLLGSAADATALAGSAARNGGAGGPDDWTSPCQFVRLRLTEITCMAGVRLPEGLELQVPGSAVDLDKALATTVVHFSLQGGSWSRDALSDLEARGAILCNLRILPANSRPGPSLFSSYVRLPTSEALDLTPELIEPPSDCSQPAVNKLVAVYNFRSAWSAENLVANGRYKVLARGRAKFTQDGAVLPGKSWLEVDTEGGSLTEHMKYGSQWSVFFMFKRSIMSDPWRRASLFSLHRAGNPLACSILAWTSGRGQASVFSRVHNLDAGYTVGQRTAPVLDTRQGAWNRVGVSFDGRSQTTVINGAEARASARNQLLSYASASRDGLRDALSIGLVRGRESAMIGAFRCFGIVRGFVSVDEYDRLFEKYCK